MKHKQIAYCGLDCAVCPAFYAAERLSFDERQKIADQWSKQYNTQIKAIDIDCVGCTAKEGKHVGYCSMCEIRLCGLSRNLTTCAVCPDYACAKLDAFHKLVPQAKANLEALRNA